MGRLLQSPKIIAVGLFVVALLSRLTVIGRYVTPDEPIWVFRALRFREALLAGDWANTIQSGHPGVTVTWLGSIAIQLQLWLDPSSRIHLDWLDQIYWLSPDNADAFRHLSAFLTAARLGPILLTSLGIAALYWLLRRRINPTAATIGLLLVALDPFTAGLSSLLHLDALLATFMLLAPLFLLPNPNQSSS
jgi:hypothetical protein